MKPVNWRRQRHRRGFEPLLEQQLPHHATPHGFGGGGAWEATALSGCYTEPR